MAIDNEFLVTEVSVAVNNMDFIRFQQLLEALKCGIDTIKAVWDDLLDGFVQVDEILNHILAVKYAARHNWLVY